MIHTITNAVDDLGLDLIRQVAELAAHAVLTRNYQMQAQLFPDTHGGTGPKPMRGFSCALWRSTHTR